MAKRQDKVIISCAVTGPAHTPTMSPYLPIRREQIAQQAIEAAEAGAVTNIPTGGSKRMSIEECLAYPLKPWAR